MIDLGEISFYEANLKRINLERANLERTNLTGANLFMVNFTGAFNLSIDQLSKVRTFYNAKIDEKLLIQLKEEFPSLFKSLKQKFLEYQSNFLGANAHNNI